MNNIARMHGPFFKYPPINSKNSVFHQREIVSGELSRAWALCLGGVLLPALLCSARGRSSLSRLSVYVSICLSIYQYTEYPYAGIYRGIYIGRRGQGSSNRIIYIGGGYISPHNTGRDIEGGTKQGGQGAKYRGGTKQGRENGRGATSSMKKRQICPNIFMHYLIRGVLSDYFLASEGKGWVIDPKPPIRTLKPIYISISQQLRYSKNILDL